MDCQVNLLCSAIMEWQNGRRQVYKGASFSLLRNEHREIILQMTSDKLQPVRLPLKSINVHNKFMSEGKATIVFKELSCTLLLSNAPPTDLATFLKVIFVKITSEKESKSSDVKTRLLSSKPKVLEDISPVTLSEVYKVKSKISRSSDTTPSPSRKRKLNENNIPSAKRLYTAFNEETPLNDEQKRILSSCLLGYNIFFTGSAGTGKSFLLKKIIKALPPDVTVATASTGVAACHIGGTTLHAFAGIGGGEATIERCFQMVSKSAVAQKWRKCKHLVIDEISMIGGDYFEKLEMVARHIRRNDKPFGGIQLILCGDFLQLPPVSKKSKDSLRFCFQTDTWDKCIKRLFELKTVHRQKDQEFISILNSIRIGRVTDEIKEKILATSKQNIETDGILATRLCSHTNDSKLINESKLKLLKGEEKVFTAQDSEPHSSNQLDSNTIAPSKIILKEGAQVMLLKNINISAGLVNGARGVIVRFDNGLPVVRFKSQKEYIAKSERWIVKGSNGALLSRQQIPLDLAWAFSIHKSQGLTLDCVEMSLSKIFEAGQAYVALSRAQSLESLRVLDFDPRQVWANPVVLEFYQKFRRMLFQLEFIPLGKQITEKKKANLSEKVTSRAVKSLKNTPLLNIC